MRTHMVFCMEIDSGYFLGREMLNTGSSGLYTVT